MAKKSMKAAKAALPRPIISPYTSPLVSLHFGPTHQKYYLPAALLERLENIPSRDPWTGETHLKDVDASIGHILVHFLYTGVYQTLHNEDVEDVDRGIVRNEFQKAALALQAAKKYSVPGLQELAQIELERRGKDMCLRDAVRAIPEEFVTGAPNEHAWLRDYVSGKVRWAFEHDRPTISAPDFFENIESPTLIKLLAQTIIGLYGEEVDQLRKGKTTTPDPPTPPSEHTIATSAGWPASVEKFGAFDDSAAAWDPQNLHDDSVGRTPDLSALPSKLTVEASTAWPASVEKFGAFDDSAAAWDPHSLCHEPGSKSEAGAPICLPSSIKEEKEKELPHTAEEDADATADDLQQFQHGKVPSPMDQATEQYTEAVDEVMINKEENTLLDDLLSLEEGDLKEAAKTLRRKQNKLEKRLKAEEAAAKENENIEARKIEEGASEIQDPHTEQSAIAPPQEPGVATTSSTATKDETERTEAMPLSDGWGASPSTLKKKKKKKSKSKADRAPPPLVAISPPASSPDIQLEVDPTPAIPDVTAVASIVPAAEDDPNAGVDPYAGLSKSQAKKLKFKLDREARARKELEALHQKEKEEADGIRRWEEQKEKQARLVEEDAELIRLEDEEAERIRLEELATKQALLADEGMRRKKNEVEAATAVAAEAGTKEDEPWGDWAGAAPSVKKTKKKKVKAVEPLPLAEEEPEQTRLEKEATADTEAEKGRQENDLWGDWARAAPAAKKESKKAKKVKRFSPEEQAERTRQEEENKAAATATAAGAIEIGAASADEDCEFRSQHLSRDDGWHDCKPCVLYMRRIALKLHAGGLPTVDPFAPIAWAAWMEKVTVLTK